MTTGNEIIVVRSLTTSDLGLFAAHRATASSKQRAININADVAQRLLSRDIFDGTQARIVCRIIFGDQEQTAVRHFGKIHKNWRLGGNKIEGAEFGSLDSRDFVLIRSVEGNDGTHAMTVLFIARANESVKHARIVRLVEQVINNSMAVYLEGSAGFSELAVLFPGSEPAETSSESHPQPAKSIAVKPKPVIPPMPVDEVVKAKKRTIKQKLHSPHILEQMLKVSSDLSAPAQLSFLETVEMMATQLRTVLIASNRIIKLEKNHNRAWKAVRGQMTGFVDGGLANLSMLGSAPIAARVGGYVVTPGDTSPERERYVMLKKLINELYSSASGGVYDGSFPDISAIRDAARITIEAAGAVRLLKDEPSLKYLFLHGALVNPVSRYTDKMYNGEPRYRFPDFSTETVKDLLPDEKPLPKGRDANFINVYLKQLQALQKSETVVCGVIEREATTSSVIRAVLNSLDDTIIRDCLPVPPEEWKEWFRNMIDPTDDDQEMGRITDSLLFRCVLEPEEVLVPIEIDRNEMRRAPEAWKEVIVDYPKPLVSYLQPNEWSSPIRLEIFAKDLPRFEQTADLILHCCLLLPRYAFPAGLDIVDKFAKIPDWMSRPVNTNTAVQALKQALYKGDERLFDSLRRMLCGSSREWLLRPNMLK